MGRKVPAGEQLRDLLPLAAQPTMGIEKDFIVLLAPGLVIDGRIEVVVPSTCFGWYLSRHCLPVRSLVLPSVSFSDTRVQFFMPYFLMILMSLSSSCMGKQVPTTTSLSGITYECLLINIAQIIV